MTTTTPRPYGPLKWRLPPVLVRLDDPTESLARSVSRNRGRVDQTRPPRRTKGDLPGPITGQANTAPKQGENQV